MEHGPAHTLVLDSWPPDCERMHFCHLKPSEFLVFCYRKINAAWPRHPPRTGFRDTWPGLARSGQSHPSLPEEIHHLAEDPEPGLAQLLPEADHSVVTQCVVGSLGIPVWHPQKPIHSVGATVPSGSFFSVAPGLTKCLAHGRAFCN